MPLSTGLRLGAYEIVGLIGAGGMGEVYRARDTKLGRDVAIKILPSSFALDPERLSRLDREARVLASLNHPHIGAIYGLEEAAGLRGLVLELVDGETLADRLARGPLSMPEAIGTASQIAGALDAAHAKGIVHRDLKPANIKITKGGLTKVLDFGLAKADTTADAETALATGAGAVMGTPAYMSPEQARGEAVDQQTDIWAFGCVLYEMLTARRAFGGATASDAIAAVLKVEPDWRALPPETPAAARKVLARCLAKDPSRRLHSVADARLDLLDAAATSLPSSETLAAREGRPGAHRFLFLGICAAIAIIAAYAAGAWRARAALPRDQYVVDFDPPEGTRPTAMALSLDGRALALAVQPLDVAAGTDRSELWVRSLRRPGGWSRVNGGESGSQPFWSPDSRRLAFFADGKLKWVELPGGAPLVICDAPNPRGGAWLENGTIVFAENRSGPLMRVDAGGGRPAVLIPVGPGQTSLRLPVAVRGSTFLYFAQFDDLSRSEIRLASLEAPDKSVQVVQSGRGGAYDRGILFYEREGQLVGRRFDADVNRFSDEPFRVPVDDAASEGVTGSFALAAGGGHVAVRTSRAGLSQLTWLSHDGRPLGEVGAPADQQDPDLSRDGQRLAISRRVAGEINHSIWTVEVETGASRQLASGYNDSRPLWSVDGSHIAFGSSRGLGGFANAYLVSASGDGRVTPLVEMLNAVTPAGWTPDGTGFVWSSGMARFGDPAERLGIFVSAGTPPTHTPFRTGVAISEAQTSPDATRIAYTSRESGRQEVYVDTFPVPGGRPVRASRDGGQLSRWRGDGRELYFSSLDARLMAVAIPAVPGGPPASPIELFKLPQVGGIPAGYAPDPRGSRFLVLVPKSDPAFGIRLTLNWSPPASK